jgi:hypothetical protein
MSASGASALVSVVHWPARAARSSRTAGKPQPQVGLGHRGKPDPLDQVRKLTGRLADPGHINAMRSDTGVLIECRRAAPQQRDGSATVAASGMSEPDGKLGEPLPKVALVGRGRFPCQLEYFVRMEWPASVDQVLRLRQRVARSQAQLVGRRGLAARGSVERPAKPVSWPGIPRPA